VEPYNRFSGNRLVQGSDGIDVERVTTIPADFFEGKLYSDDMLEKYNCA